MTTINRGYSFGATEQVTNTKLHTLVDSATLGSVAQTDIANGEGFVHRGTSAPTDTDQLWADTSLTPVILKVYDGANWVPTDELNILTNRAGVTLSAGHVVIVDTSNTESVKTTSTQGDLKWRGIALTTVTNTSTGVFKTHGYVPNVALEISASAGCFLTCSTASGKAVQVASGSAGIFAIVTTSGTASAGAYLLGRCSEGTYTPSASNALSGSVVQVVNTQTGVVATGSTVIPYDDTIPQNTEGDQYMTLAITPLSTTNLLIIQVTAILTNSVTENIGVAIFQDSTAGALAAVNSANSTAAWPNVITFTHKMTAGTTSATTFKVRAGAASGTITFNGTGGVRKYGGVLASSITIFEIKA